MHNRGMEEKGQNIELDMLLDWWHESERQREIKCKAVIDELVKSLIDANEEIEKHIKNSIAIENGQSGQSTINFFRKDRKVGLNNERRIISSLTGDLLKLQDDLDNEKHRMMAICENQKSDDIGILSRDELFKFLYNKFDKSKDLFPDQLVKMEYVKFLGEEGYSKLQKKYIDLKEMLENEDLDHVKRDELNRLILSIDQVIKIYLGVFCKFISDDPEGADQEIIKAIRQVSLLTDAINKVDSVIPEDDMTELCESSRAIVGELQGMFTGKYKEFENNNREKYEKYKNEVGSEFKEVIDTERTYLDSIKSFLKFFDKLVKDDLEIKFPMNIIKNVSILRKLLEDGEEFYDRLKSSSNLEEAFSSKEFREHLLNMAKATVTFEETTTYFHEEKFSESFSQISDHTIQSVLITSVQRSMRYRLFMDKIIELSHKHDIAVESLKHCRDDLVVFLEKLNSKYKRVVDEINKLILETSQDNRKNALIQLLYDVIHSGTEDLEKIDKILSEFIATNPDINEFSFKGGIKRIANLNFGYTSTHKALEAIRLEVFGSWDLAGAGWKKQLGNYAIEPPESRRDVQRIDNGLDSEAISTKVKDLLGERGYEVLTSDCAPPSTSAREKFIDCLVNAAKRSDNISATAVYPPGAGLIDIEKLLGKEGLQLYQDALHEERMSREFREAVFLEATRFRADEDRWAKPLFLWVGGPSGVGKSTNANFIVGELHDHLDKAEGGEGQGNYLVAIDGEIERNVSQIRGLLYDLSLHKGFDGVSDLEGITKDKHLKMKDIVQEAVEVSENGLSMVIPATFTEGDLISKKIPEYSARDDINHAYSRVTGEDSNVLRETTKIQGKRRERPLKSHKGDPVLINNRRHAAAGKDYDDGIGGCKFKAGEHRGGVGEKAYNAAQEMNGREILCVEAVNDSVFVKFNKERNPPQWMRCSDADIYATNLVRMSMRCYRKYRDLLKSNDGDVKQLLDKKSLEEWMKRDEQIEETRIRLIKSWTDPASESVLDLVESESGSEFVIQNDSSVHDFHVDNFSDGVEERSQSSPVSEGVDDEDDIDNIKWIYDKSNNTASFRVTLPDEEVCRIINTLFGSVFREIGSLQDDRLTSAASQSGPESYVTVFPVAIPAVSMAGASAGNKPSEPSVEMVTIRKQDTSKVYMSNTMLGALKNDKTYELLYKTAQSLLDDYIRQLEVSGKPRDSVVCKPSARAPAALLAAMEAYSNSLKPPVKLSIETSGSMTEALQKARTEMSEYVKGRSELLIIETTGKSVSQTFGPG